MMNRIAVLLASILAAVGCSLEDNPDLTKKEYPFTSFYTDEIADGQLNGLYRIARKGFSGNYMNSPGWPGGILYYVLFNENNPSDLFVNAYVFTEIETDSGVWPRQEISLNVTEKEALYLNTEGRSLKTNIAGFFFPSVKETEDWYLMHSDKELLVFSMEPEATEGFVMEKIKDADIITKLQLAEYGTVDDAINYCMSIWKRTLKNQ